MKTWQVITLAVLCAAMLLGIILTWGSMGSVILLFCLISAGAALLIRYFLMDRNTDDYQMDV